MTLRPGNRRIGPSLQGLIPEVLTALASNTDKDFWAAIGVRTGVRPYSSL